MVTVELIYDAGCPHVKCARRNLMVALENATLPAHWTEWCRGAAVSPVHTRGYGSPTILVNGHDVSPVPIQSGAACRLYLGENGSLQGAPTVDDIAGALGREMARGLDQPSRFGAPRSA
jgi:hypothetical protein